MHQRIRCKSFVPNPENPSEFYRNVIRKDEYRTVYGDVVVRESIGQCSS